MDVKVIAVSSEASLSSVKIILIAVSSEATLSSVKIILIDLVC